MCTIFCSYRGCGYLCLFVFVQGFHSQLYIKGEGSAGKLQHQKQKQRHLSRGAEDESAGAASAQLECPRLQGVEPV